MRLYVVANEAGFLEYGVGRRYRRGCDWAIGERWAGPGEEGGMDVRRGTSVLQGDRLGCWGKMG